MYRFVAVAVFGAWVMCGCGGDGSPASPPTYTLGGNVTGLNGTVVLEDNGANAVSLSASGTYTFSAALTTGAAYTVTVSTQPVGQTCTVPNPSGTMGSANITAIHVICAANDYTIGGTITGLAFNGLELLNGSDLLTIAGKASTFVFPTAVAYQGQYQVKIGAQPPGQTCSLANGSGSVGAANVTSVAVTCVNTALTAVPAPAAAPGCTTNCLYVDAMSGSDSNLGTTPATAFQTLNKASSVVVPGSVVLIMSGTYTSDGSEAPLTISTSGTSKAYIEFAAAPGQQPVIQIPNGSGAYAGIHIVGASYIIIDGLEVVGQNQSITAQQAAANDGTQALLNENCLYVDGAFTGTQAPFPPEPHSIVITNSAFHDCSGAGILANVADLLTIAYNQVYDNGWWTVNGSSGIDLYHLTEVNVSGSTAPQYRNLIVGNLIYNNYNTLPWSAGQPPGIYDGDGLIVDDSLHTLPALGPYDFQNQPYLGRTYIVNNISHDNGGRGVHSVNSAHIDVANNTAYNNLLTNSPYILCCEIDGDASQDENFVNNIGITLNATAVDENDANLYEFNIWNGANLPSLGNYDVTTPAALTAPATGNFAPASGSPALGSGTDAFAPTLDFNGAVRTAGKVDRGAIQVTQ